MRGGVRPPATISDDQVTSLLRVRTTPKAPTATIQPSATSTAGQNESSYSEASPSTTEMAAFGR